MLTWLIAAAVLIVVAGLLLYWELIVCEGAHLGAEVVIWLYDLYAQRYDRVKNYDDADEAYYLAEPLLAALQAAGPAPFVLDVATGTGRLPLALLREASFNGRTISLDLSRAMLALAAPKLAPYAGRAALVWHAAVPLPFPDATFDALTCLEALEFLPDPAAPLHEFARVLRPGGVLLLTRRKSRWLLGHTQSRLRFEQLVTAAGLEQVETRVWQVDYDQVWARKPGALARQGTRLLLEVLCCPACGATALAPSAPGGLACTACGAQVPVGEDGVIEAVAGVAPQA